MKNVYLSSWNMLDQVILLFIKLGFNSYFISKILYLITTFFISFSLLHLTMLLTNSKILSIITVLLQYITFFNIGFGDYPGWIVSPHLHFLTSQSMILLGIFFLIKKNFKPLIGIILLTIGFHIIMGLWFLINFIILYFFLNKEIQLKINLALRNNYYIYLSIILLAISLFIFLFLKNNFYLLIGFESSGADSKELLNIYINKWDYHRSFNELHKNTLIRIFIILLMLAYLFCKQKDNSFLIKFLIIIIINSLILFIFDRIFTNYGFVKHKIFMPSRFINQTSFFSLVIISSFMFQLIKDINNYFLKSKFLKVLKLIHIILAICFCYIFSILDPAAIATKKSIMTKKNVDLKFWKQVEAKKIKGSVLTNFDSSILSTIHGDKIPVISNFGYDFLPYHTEFIFFFKDFVEDFLSEDFTEPSNLIKNKGYIPDELLKEKIETFSVNRWDYLSKKYFLSGLILPLNWNITLKPVIIGNNFKYYSLDGKLN